MNGVPAIGAATSLPATTVLRLSGKRPVEAHRNDEAEQALIAAVTHPPRIGETRPIAALMPELLARYGLEEFNSLAGSKLAPGSPESDAFTDEPGPRLVLAIDYVA